MPVNKGDGDVPAGDAPVEVGDLIGYRDDGGALHLAVAYMDYPAFLPDGSYDPKQGFHVAYFSDHPGDEVSRSEARSALGDFRRLTWYLMPFRDQLDQNTCYNPRSRQAIDEVLARLPATQFLTHATGEPCPEPGLWIMRGTDRTVHLKAGEPMPGHAYFANYPPQWTRWDLPLD